MKHPTLLLLDHHTDYPDCRPPDARQAAEFAGGSLKNWHRYMVRYQRHYAAQRTSGSTS